LPTTRDDQRKCLGIGGNTETYEAMLLAQLDDLVGDRCCQLEAACKHRVT
jgi:hypothetical protein